MVFDCVLCLFRVSWLSPTPMCKQEHWLLRPEKKRGGKCCEEAQLLIVDNSQNHRTFTVVRHFICLAFEPSSWPLQIICCSFSLSFVPDQNFFSSEKNNQSIPTCTLHRLTSSASFASPDLNWPPLQNITTVLNVFMHNSSDGSFWKLEILCNSYDWLSESLSIISWTLCAERSVFQCYQGPMFAFCI